MEGGESILDTIYEEDNIDDLEDVEMVDIEEGEFVEENHPQNDQAGNAEGNANVVNGDSQSKLSKRRRNRRKKKKRNNGSAPPVTDINRFVLETCRRLKEKKSYMIYTAIGCLGVSALSDLIKEVDAVQACGGQMTADGRRPRNGGGILWSIMKSREPKAYAEIMRKAREFEKQFRQQNVRPKTEQSSGIAQEPAIAPTDEITMVSDQPELPQMQNQAENSNSEEKRISVHNRIRVPVSYDDLLVEDTQNDAALTV